MAVIVLVCASLAFAQADFPGAVYLASNSPQSNTVLVFNRASNGSLRPAGSFATGGLGTGGGLGNQGGVILSENNRWLLVVNAGSNDISVFAVLPDGLRLTDREPSGGLHPVSVTEKNRLVYVLNAGGAVGGQDSISGFRLSPEGLLQAIPGSIQPLSAASTGPAEIGFTPDGGTLLVSEKNTNVLDTFAIAEDATAQGPAVHAANGVTPFGFAFAKRDQVLISDAHGAPGITGSAVSAYELDSDGLRPIGSPSATQHVAACWVVITQDGRFAYTTNTGDGTISGFAISFDGTLSLLNPNGTTAVAGAGPIDAALSNDSRFLYVLNSGSASLSAFGVGADGSLRPVPGIAGLPAGANGVAAR
jgi:6-phosphogluconolactonase (cycloisomerase 2 family)